MNLKKHLIAAITLTAVVLSAASAVAANGTPVDIVGQKYRRITKIVAENKTRPALEKAIRAEMDTFVDYNELGRRTLSAEWKKLDRRDRKRFVDGFKQMIQRSYVKRFNPDAAFDVEIGKAKKEKDAVIVKSTIRSGRSEADVSYAFAKNKKHWMVHDVIIDHVSMVKNYRRQFYRIIQKDGFDGLMKKIEKKNAEYRN